MNCPPTIPTAGFLEVDGSESRKKLQHWEYEGEAEEGGREGVGAEQAVEEHGERKEEAQPDHEEEVET